jgi:hypothetical protein
MYLKKTGLIMSLALLFLFAWTSSIWAARHEYQNRGNRYEGVKPKPVSGYDIELISARVDYHEEVNQTPDRFKVRFYLEQPSQAYLTVRELDYKYYYWMDKVQPPGPWQPGFHNEFEWPTQEVIQQLDQVKMYDLGIVVRLEKPEPGKVERVAPAIFYHSQPPPTIKGYLFTFKTNGDAKLTCSFYKEGELKPVFTRSFKQRGGRPFTVRWDSSTATGGSYKLVVKGYFLDTNDPIDQIVYFYHQPVVN